MMNVFRRLHRISLAAIAMSVAAASTLPSQQLGRGPRWQGFFGCWTVARAGTAQDSQGDSRIVCISPTSDPDVADISAIDDGRVAARERIDASGRTVAVVKEGCIGSQHARWSADERRVYLRSSVNCAGSPRETSAILALTASGDWIDVRRIAARPGDTISTIVRVARYHDIGLPSEVPDSIARQLRVRGMSIAVGRIAATAPINSDAVIEAVRRADAAMAEAWVMESGDLLALSSRDLRALTDSGVPERVLAAARAADDARRSFSERPNWDGRDGSFRAFGRTTSDAWDQGIGTKNVFPEHARRSLYDPWGNGVWFYAPYSTRSWYGSTRGVVDGDGFEYFRMPTSLFGDRTTVTGYVKPPVLVLHDDPSAASEAPAITKGDGGKREIPDAAAAAVAKAVAEARPAPPTERKPTGKSAPVRLP